MTVCAREGCLKRTLPVEARDRFETTLPRRSLELRPELLELLACSRFENGTSRVPVVLDRPRLPLPKSCVADIVTRDLSWQAQVSWKGGARTARMGDVISSPYDRVRDVTTARSKGEGNERSTDGLLASSPTENCQGQGYLIPSGKRLHDLFLCGEKKLRSSIYGSKLASALATCFSQQLLVVNVTASLRRHQCGVVDLN